jgi:hypothetical protein
LEGADMIYAIKRLLGIVPSVYNLPYNERVYLVALSTAVQRVR